MANVFINFTGLHRTKELVEETNIIKTEPQTELSAVKKTRNKKFRTYTGVIKLNFKCSFAAVDSQ